MMKVETTRFGTIELNETSAITMAKGPLGFEDQTKFALIQHLPDTKFRWLQSMTEPWLAFVVVDPTDFFTDYEFEIPDTEAQMLHLESEDDSLVLLVVTIDNESQQVSVNLAAPIVVNSKELIGMQVVLQDSRYSIKHILPKRESTTDNRTQVTVNSA